MSRRKRSIQRRRHRDDQNRAAPMRAAHRFADATQASNPSAEFASKGDFSTSAMTSSHSNQTPPSTVGRLTVQILNATLARKFPMRRIVDKIFTNLTDNQAQLQ